MQADEVSVIIPAYNEQETIVRTIRTARKAFPTAQIILADSESTDQTVARARETDARIVAAERGKGRAMTAGVARAAKPIILFVDADIKNLSPAMLKKLVAPIQNNDGDVTIASFSSPYPQSFTELAYRPLMRLLFPEVESAIKEAPLSGQRAMTRKTARSLKLSPGFGVEAAMNVDIVLAGLKVKAVPLGAIDPVFKGTLGPAVLRKRAKEIAAAILAKAKEHGRLGRLAKADCPAVLKGVTDAFGSGKGL